MGRTINYDIEVQNSLYHIFKSKLEHAGLIIGQRTPQKDIVVRLCPVPAKEETTEKATPLDQETDLHKKKTSTNTPKSKSNSKIELDDVWIAQYSKEVTRTLPGGFDVLGLYVASASDHETKLQPKMRQVLFSISGALKKDWKRSICSQITDNIVLFITTDTNKVICRTYDISEIKSTPNPAEWKYFVGTTKWHELKTRLAVDLKFAVKSENSSLSVKGQIYSSLTNYFNNVDNAVALINNVLKEPEEMLDPSSDSKKSKKQQLVPSAESYDVDILFKLESSKNIIPSVTSECITMLTFKGNIQCRAFVHQKATVKEAIQAMKQDIVRTITARCEIHCEDLLVIDEESQDPVVVYELPKRVFAPLPQSNLLVCDYQFHGDMAGDSLHAFKELLNLELNEQDVETSSEVSPATSALIQPEVMEDRLSEFGDNPLPKKNIFYPVASAAVAAVAAGLSYFLFLQDT